jgi:hypothetical protein
LSYLPGVSDLSQELHNWREELEQTDNKVQLNVSKASFTAFSVTDYLANKNLKDPIAIYKDIQGNFMQGIDLDLK